ncbi:mitochondrial 54S ribosomal protein YmL41 [Tieghemiomyces parasiticus]|uniref:Large ribosomal subunit protein uL23m n=1 Tax=Tieghemiomyces parasiticus TaxID=78921 RepID=A0A9W8E081_9FUNG|nr:mitochondrial 54S ribosomal protein YmL41 [Tieghemiomyces parasiticus]
MATPACTTRALQQFGRQVVYFPEHIFRLVRTKRLESNQAAFKVPIRVNKLDIRDYLTHLYGVSVRDVRTVIYPGSHKYSQQERRWIRIPRVKKAIVTFDGSFQFPEPPVAEEPKKPWQRPSDQNLEAQAGGEKEVTVDPYGIKQGKLRMAVLEHKLKGWVGRSKEKTELRQLLEKRAEDREAAKKKKEEAAKASAASKN